MTASETQTSDLASVRRDAEAELQLLRRGDPLEAFERADRLRVAYVKAAPSQPWHSLSVRSFWLGIAILGVLAAVVARSILRR